MVNRAGTTGTPESADWHGRSLHELRQSGNVTLACRKSRVPRRTAYNHRDTNEPFREAWDLALEESVDVLDAVARHRAIHGWLEPVFHKGIVVGHIRRYDHRLLAFLLKAHGGDKYRDRPSTEDAGDVLKKLADVFRQVTESEGSRA